MLYLVGKYKEMKNNSRRHARKEMRCNREVSSAISAGNSLIRT
jgi:hypothetical protein